MTSIRWWLLIGLLACAAQSGAPQSAAAQPGAAQNADFVPVAHSALVTVEAAGTAEGVRLRLRHTEGGAPLAVTELHVSLEGQNTSVRQEPDGTWLAPWPKSGATANAGLEVIVTHDGIREVLSGPLPAAPDHKPPAGSGASGGAGRKQLAWWILNVAIVLIAVIAISRRMS